jgi:hypothetical protein
MKRTKVIATLFILFSASLMNYHNRSVSSVNICNRSERVMCADSKSISESPAPINPDYEVKENKACTDSESDYSTVDQMTSPGKNYEANMVIM